jgi:hypothetical protein
MVANPIKDRQPMVGKFATVAASPYSRPLVAMCTIGFRFCVSESAGHG